MNHAKWIEHFTRNKQNRPEPDWSAPINMPPGVLVPMLRSVEQFRLGDGGGPASLIAYDADGFRNRTAEMRQIVDLWFAEEAEHARLLGCAVARFGGRMITSHWSFTAFCLCRRVLGVKFELQVLTLTELVSTAYYRMLRNHSPDGPLAAMCELILRDEGGHVAFQRDRLAAAEVPQPGWRGWWWRTQFLVCGYAAGTMLWINHAPCLKAIGGARGEYYGEITRQMTRFIRSLRRGVKPAGVYRPVGKTGKPATSTSKMNNVTLNDNWKRWLVVVAYAAAMAWVESAVVYYLRTHVDRIQPYQPNPLPLIGGLGPVELAREFATLVMLFTVGMLAGKNWRARFGYMLLAFGVWDIFYYVFLKVMCGWPNSLHDWDILFLLPLPWWGPVLAPVSIAGLMIVWGTLASQFERTPAPWLSNWRVWVLNLIGVGLALYVFMADAIRVADGGVDALRNLLPTYFNWPLFCVALALMAAPVARLCFQLRPQKISRVEFETRQNQINAQ